jgi:hypothetical protein
MHLPQWLSVNQPTGTLQPLTSKELTFTVSSGVNLGTYTEQIGITSGNLIAKNLPLNLLVTGKHPEGWSVNPSDYESTMTVTGRIQIEGVYQTDAADILAAFIGDECVGITSPIEPLTGSNEYYTFLTVYGNSAHVGDTIKFKVWDASTGNVYSVIESKTGATVQDFTFLANDVIGTVSIPAVHNALNMIEQSIALNNGWSWISVNVTNTNPTILQQFKDRIGSAGELLKEQSGTYIQNPGWAGTLTAINKEAMYLVKTTAATTLRLDGQAAAPATTPINLAKGWNGIGYIPQFTLPVNEALANLNAQIDDQVKGQSSYRTYAGPTVGWVGTLNYMRAGEGYMYNSGVAGKSFTYPSTTSQVYHAPALRSAANTTEQKWSVDMHRFPSTMTVTSVAWIDDVELQSDQIEIAAFVGEDCRGSILLQNVEGLDRHLGFLMVYGESSEALNFKIFDHTTDTEYAAYPNISFASDAIYGNPANPFKISNQLTGLKDISVQQINVYPNPVSDWLQINHDLESIDVLQVVDISGRLVLERTDFVEQSLNVSALANGVYLLRLTKDSETVIIKVTKK